MYIHMHNFLENWWLNIYEHMSEVAVMVYVFSKYSKSSVKDLDTVGIEIMQKVPEDTEEETRPTTEPKEDTACFFRRIW